MTIGFMVSPTPSLGHRNDDRFRGFMVSWFRPLHLWDMEMTIGFMVLWYHGFTHSISGNKLDTEFAKLYLAQPAAEGSRRNTERHYKEEEGEANAGVNTKLFVFPI